MFAALRHPRLCYGCAMPCLRAVAVACAIILAALLGLGADVSAQTAEIAAFGGYGFGGSLTSPAGGQAVSMEAGPLVGAAFSAPISRTWRVEGIFSRQASRLADGGAGTHIDVSLERYLAAIQEEAARGRTRAFGSFFVGATRFVPSGFESDTWFTVGLGLGIKTALSTHVGLRFEARGFYTPVTSSGATVCTGGRCVFAYSGSGVFQGDLTGGVLVAF